MYVNLQCTCTIIKALKSIMLHVFIVQNFLICVYFKCYVYSNNADFLQIHFIFEIQYALIKLILIVLPIVCVFLCGTSDLILKT